VELRLDRTGLATVTIHDARGRQVRTLFSGTRGAGRHSLVFDGLDDAGRALASGVYFARMSALGEIDTTAMVLVR
jgi:flagellar hook assembly protein FlgD